MSDQKPPLTPEEKAKEQIIIWIQFPDKWLSSSDVLRTEVAKLCGWTLDELKQYVAQKRKEVAELTAGVKNQAASLPPPTITWRDTADQIILPKAPTLVDQLIYQGSSSVIVAKPKMGKTTLVLDACEAMLSHKDFLKLTTTPTNILYISEQFLSSFVTELGNSGLLGKTIHNEHMSFITAEDWYKLSWKHIVELTVTEAIRCKAGLVIFDTLSRIARLENENDASEMQAAVDITTALVKEKIAVKFVQHERKSGGNIFDAGRGTNALMGAVDCVLRLGLPPVGGQPGNYRVLEYIGRFPGPREPLIINRESADFSHRYEYIGTEFAVKSSGNKDAVMSLWSTATEKENDWLTVAIIMENSELSKLQVSRSVKTLVEDGFLTRRGDGKSGSPYEYQKRFADIVF
jgi:hypothetical protein